eukprot:symbB.v1.2.023327.t1/scaffold2128.1/size88402/5
MFNAEVPELGQGEVLLRVDKFAFSHMSLGYLMKGFTRTFSAYHNFYKSSEDTLYRSACWGFATKGFSLWQAPSKDSIPSFHFDIGCEAMAADKEGRAAGAAKPAAATTFFKGLQGGLTHRGNIQATMPMQLEAVLAKRDRAEKEHMPARPPHVFVDGMYVRGSAEVKQKPLLRHVIVKDLNKVATQLKYEVPTRGLFEKKPPMGLYCIFDGVAGAGAGTSGTGASIASIAEFCALNFHIALLNSLSELRPNECNSKGIEDALVKSLETLDQELLIRTFLMH